MENTSNKTFHYRDRYWSDVRTFQLNNHRMKIPVPWKIKELEIEFKIFRLFKVLGLWNVRICSVTRDSTHIKANKNGSEIKRNCDVVVASHVFDSFVWLSQSQLIRIDTYNRTRRNQIKPITWKIDGHEYRSTNHIHEVSKFTLH